MLYRLERLTNKGRVIRDNSIRSTWWEAERDREKALRETGIAWVVERVPREVVTTE